MRKTIIASLAAFCLSNATERIVMSCNFDAVAKGYNSFTVQQDMLLTNRHGEYRTSVGSFLNDDGTDEDKSENISISSNPNNFSSISFFDGKERHVLYFSTTYDKDMWKLDSVGAWSVNSGNIKCSWEPVNE